MKKSNVFVSSAMQEQVLAVTRTLIEAQVNIEIVYDGSLTKIVYHHDDLGLQVLMLNKIDSHWAVASFAGNRSFLDKIESDGWLTSADSVIKYFSEISPDHDIPADMLFSDRAEAFFEIADDYNVTLIYNQTAGESLETGQRLMDALTMAHGVQTFSQVSEEEPQVEVTQEPKNSDVNETPDTGAEPAPDVTEEPKVKTGKGPGFWTRARRKATNPTAMVIGGTVLSGLIGFGIYRWIRD